MRIVVLMAALLIGASGEAQENPGLSDEQSTHVAEIAAEREAADLEMRDDHWSPLAVSDMLLLKAKPVSIGSGPESDLVLHGSDVAAHHAEVIAESMGNDIRYKIQAIDGSLFIDSDEGEKVTDLLLEKGGPRVRLGRKILYYHEIDSLGSMIRVLNFDSPAYTLFDGLEYFPTDPEYRVEATINPYDEPEEVQIVDTMGFVSSAWVYGMAEFTLKGKPSRLKLVLFTPNATPDSVFYVMFGDKTNGRETYGAGRYLLPNFVPSGKIVLDFNRSVNPSCAYNRGFACPMPPKGNRFPFTVPAGIKDYEHRPAS